MERERQLELTGQSQGGEEAGEREPHRPAESPPHAQQSAHSPPTGGRGLRLTEETTERITENGTQHLPGAGTVSVQWIRLESLRIHSALG